MPCIFCQIINREIPAKIICENDGALSFLDIHPRSKGHTVIVPKIHAGTISELPPEFDGELLKTVRETIARLGNLSPDGFTIGINHGEFSGQEVPHLHVHIIPRYKGDGGSSIQSVVSNKPEASVSDVWDSIVKTVGIKQNSNRLIPK